MVLSVLGAATGGLMTQPTDAQLAAMRATRHLGAKDANEWAA